ncbi:MAG: hypothetical protein KGZ43_04315 [Sulfuritalea sp.]|nr:hypothetical protein [Sulfuritalea sp.]
MRIDAEIRQRVEQAAAVRALIESAVLPAPSFDARCEKCSSHDICQPSAHALAYGLFALEDRTMQLLNTLCVTRPTWAGRGLKHCRAQGTHPGGRRRPRRGVKSKRPMIPCRSIPAETETR